MAERAFSIFSIFSCRLIAFFLARSAVIWLVVLVPAVVIPPPGGAIKLPPGVDVGTVRPACLSSFGGEGPTAQACPDLGQLFGGEARNNAPSERVLDSGLSAPVSTPLPAK